MKPPIVIDIETVGEVWDGKLVVLGASVIGVEGGDSWEPHEIPQWVYEALADPERPIVEQSEYDARWLVLAGWDLQGPIYDTKAMANVLNENMPLNLEYLSNKYCGIVMDKRLRQRQNRALFECDDGTLLPLDEAPIDQVKRYNLEDVLATAELFETLHTLLYDSMWDDFWMEEEVPFTRVLVDMECAGLPIDVEATSALCEKWEVEQEKLLAELRTDAGLPDSFNFGSGDQLAAYLYSKVVFLKDKLYLGVEACDCLKSCITGEHEDCGEEERELHIVDLLPSGFSLDHVGREYVSGHWVVEGRDLKCKAMTPSGKRQSVSSKTLLVRFGRDPWVQKLLQWKKLNKATTTYLRSFPKYTNQGRLYGRFNQTGTVTGRLSSSEPNLQNIPSRGEIGENVRGLFRGDLVIADYSQLEPRLMAHFSGDPVLVDAYTHGKDVYIITASGIFGRPVEHDDEERGISKVVFLGTQYGASARKLAEILSINGFPTSRGTAAQYLDEFEKLYATLARWKRAVIRRAHEKGYVKTLAGRHRRLRKTLDDPTWKTMAYGERQAVNAIIQGSAADVVRRTMVRWPTYEKCLQHLTLLAQVHDELLWEYDAEHFLPHHDGWPDYYLGLLRECGEVGHGFDLRVPLVFEPFVCQTWAQKGEGILLPEDLEDDDEEAA